MKGSFFGVKQLVFLARVRLTISQATSKGPNGGCPADPKPRKDPRCDVAVRFALLRSMTISQSQIGQNQAFTVGGWSGDMVDTRRLFCNLLVSGFAFFRVLGRKMASNCL